MTPLLGTLITKLIQGVASLSNPKYRQEVSMRFLETITFMENDVLIPIDKIKYVMYRINSQGSHEISIKGEDEFEWFELFNDENKARKRYNNIKEILEAK